MQINQTARAKINLCLHLTGVRDDGYHLLDSLVVFANIGDQLSAKGADELSLNITGPYGKGLSAGADNLVSKAAAFYMGVGAEITLQKNLPVASGIGGGSADAAATLHVMSDLSGQDLPADMGLSLGADVPVCVLGKPCRMQGIGEEISTVSFLPAMPVVLVCPDVGVSTAAVFKSIPCKNNAPLVMPSGDKMTVDQTIVFLKTTRNDMQDTAQTIAPVIADVIAAIENTGAGLARMSGSGATCFGLFRTDEDAMKAAEGIAANHPNWWVQSGVLNKS